MKSADTKKILIIAYTFWPMNIVGAIRPVHLASALLKHGYDPIVLTTKPWDENIADYEFGREAASRIETVRTKFFWPDWALRRTRRIVLPRLQALADRYSHRKIVADAVRSLANLFDRFVFFLDRFLDEPLWNLGVLVSGVRIVRRADVDCIFCTVPPCSSLVPATLVARITKTPLVADFRDLWTLHEYYKASAGGIFSRVKARFDGAMESFALAGCSRIIYNTPTAKSQMDAKYPSCASKSTAITNGIVGEATDNLAAREKNGKFIISHVGSLYRDRDPANFFSGLRQWLDEKGEGFEEKIVVQFTGRGSNQIQDLAAKHGVSKIVKTHSQKSKRELRQFLAQTDLFLLCLGHRSESKYVIPAKMYDYLGAEKPLIAFAPRDGEVFHLMDKIGLGENVITQPDPKQVGQILDREYDRSIAATHAFSLPAKIREEYEYSTVTDRIEQVIAVAMREQRKE